MTSDTDCEAFDTRHEIVRRAERDDPAVVDDRDTIAEMFRFVNVMRREQHRVAVLPRSRDFVVQLAAGLRIPARGRLVLKHDLRSVHEGERERQPLPLSFRQRVERRIGFFDQRESLEKFLGCGALRVKGSEQRQRFTRRDLVLQGRGL